MFNFPIKNDNSIFVSIAAYRDKDCINTILDCFQKANNPKNIFIGICQQNKKDDPDCIYNEQYNQLVPYLNNIKVIRIPYYEAKGPTYARYLCSTLFNGENYYLQIDSHIRFVKNWDQLAIQMIQQTGSPKTVLSYYSKTIEHANHTDKQLTHVPRICKSFFNDRGMISFLGAEELPIHNQPYQTPYIAAGFIFANSSFLHHIPFDPYLPNLFVGEEILLSIRFWTHGWDIYSPNKNIVFHKYTRKDEPHVWDDNVFNDLEAFAKVKNLIGLSNEPIPESVNKQLEIYGLGKSRSLQDYYKFAGIDINNKKVTSNFCRPNNIETNKETFTNLIQPHLDYYEKFSNLKETNNNPTNKTNYNIWLLGLLGIILLILCIKSYQGV
jgi:[Skp1-protein]-hydroxyproline N-acetylglucosaminyltransferase